ncbi:MAG: nitronate monooxygenase [Bacteroidales bacterium]|nr:MAG: nitronate monooxygenase [Bacteroidales bacterium]
MKTPVTELFGIEFPVIQGGMIWCAGWELASAVGNAGGLGLIGAGSMNPDLLREQIRKANNVANGKFGVNVPLLYTQVNDIMQVIIDERVSVVFTSAGNPKIWTSTLKEKGIKVAHVVSSQKFAVKCEEAGVDAIVAEGFEAGGHNGKEETTTLTLVPLVRKVTALPLIAAGGIATGRAMLAAMVLGADGVQMGTRFAASTESSAHINFKNEILRTGEGDTHLVMKQLAPVRLIKNEFYNQVLNAELSGKSKEELKEILGQGRARKGMFEGDLSAGELEIGQVSALIEDIIPVNEIMQNIIREFSLAKNELQKL